MQPTLCARCKKNVAVVFITRIENGVSRNEGICLKCARELGIKPVEDMMQKMGINDDDLDGLNNEMMSAFGGAEGMEGLMPAEDGGGERTTTGKPRPSPFSTSCSAGARTAERNRSALPRKRNKTAGANAEAKTSFWKTTASRFRSARGKGSLITSSVGSRRLSAWSRY